MELFVSHSSICVGVLAVLGLMYLARAVIAAMRHVLVVVFALLLGVYLAQHGGLNFGELLIANWKKISMPIYNGSDFFKH